MTSSVAALTLLGSQANGQTLVSDLTQTWISMGDERKWRKEGVEALVRARLLTLSELDSHVYKKLSAKQGFPAAVECALNLVRIHSCSLLFTPRNEEN